MTKEQLSPQYLRWEIQRQVQIDPQELFKLLGYLHRPLEGYYPTEDDYQKLEKIARELCLRGKKVKIPQQDIEIGGWKLVEEMHGGYEGPGGYYRETLGKGILLYQKSLPESEQHPAAHSWGRARSSINVEVWKQGRKVIFLALRETSESGYVGIDNHYGTDTTWEIISLRVVKL